MVVVRLARGGNRHRPFFFVVVADSRARRDGRFIEKIGFYNPLAVKDQEEFRINSERLAYWSSVGAQMSTTVAKLNKKVSL